MYQWLRYFTKINTFFKIPRHWPAGFGHLSGVARGGGRILAILNDFLVSEIFSREVGWKSIYSHPRLRLWDTSLDIVQIISFKISFCEVELLLYFINTFLFSISITCNCASSLYLFKHIYGSHKSSYLFFLNPGQHIKIN